MHGSGTCNSSSCGGSTVCMFGDRQTAANTAAFGNIGSRSTAAAVVLVVGVVLAAMSCRSDSCGRFAVSSSSSSVSCNSSCDSAFGQQAVAAGTLNGLAQVRLLQLRFPAFQTCTRLTLTVWCSYESRGPQLQQPAGSCVCMYSASCLQQQQKQKQQWLLGGWSVFGVGGHGLGFGWCCVRQQWQQWQQWVAVLRPETYMQSVKVSCAAACLHRGCSCCIVSGVQGCAGRQGGGLGVGWWPTSQQVGLVVVR